MVNLRNNNSFNQMGRCLAWMEEGHMQGSRNVIT